MSHILLKFPISLDALLTFSKLIHVELTFFEYQFYYFISSIQHCSCKSLTAINCAQIITFFLLGVAYRGKTDKKGEPSNAVGLRTGMYKRGKLPKGSQLAPGPTITSFIDIRKKRGGYMLQDVAVPGAFLQPYIVGSALASGALRKTEQFPHGQQWHALLKVSSLIR